MLRTIRLSLDVSEALHRRIHEAARRRGCSARALILSSIEREIALEASVKGRVRSPLVPSKGNPVNPTRDQIYDAMFS